MLKVENSSSINQGSARHNWLCESCERAPAAFLCKADNASLCVACDSDIHSANPLSRRHHRVPIISDMGYGASGSGLIMSQQTHDIDGEDEDEAASWLLLNPVKNSGGMFGGGGEVLNEYLEIGDYTSPQFNDSVVPIQYGKGKENNNQVQECFYQLGLDYESSTTRYDYHASISHSVSPSSMDVGVVPESTSEGSICHQRAPKGTTTDLFTGTALSQMPTPLTPMDREARVLRYREKKKNRKFEKTIRYASRKAYAETRPRIKGRFAKRNNTDVEVEVDQMFSSSLANYGIVPSFL